MYKVKRIAQAMQLWKDLFFWLKLGVVTTKQVTQALKGAGSFQTPFPDLKTNVGPFVHAETFENTVLAREEFLPSDWDKFSLKYREEDEHGHFLNNAFSDVNALPFGVWKWSRGARRVFHVGKELQMFLEATSLGDTLWSDITFPFDHFYISLDEHIPGNQHQYDGILVSMCDLREVWNPEELTEEELATVPSRMLDITLFPKELGNFHLLPKNTRKIFQKALKQNRVQQLWQLCNEHASKGFYRPQLGRLLLFPDEFGDTPISAKVSDLLQNEFMHSVLDTDSNRHLNKTFTEDSKEIALKLVLGLCVYLESSEAEGGQIKTTPPSERTNNSLDEKFITNSCNFYDLELNYEILTEEEQALLKSNADIRRAYREMGFHWRRKHKRYPPGMKGAPGAKKTVEVKACRVRPDKAPEYGLVPGTRQVVAKN